MNAVSTRFVLGCSQLGGLYRSITDEDAWQTLDAAWEAGVRHFDTAPHYGAGLSERRVGAFLASKPRDQFVLTTKVGRLLVPTDDDVEGVDGFYGGGQCHRVLDYSADGVRRSADESLDRLGLDRIDGLYVHDADDHIDQAVSEAVPALVELRRQGVVSHVGAGMNSVAPMMRIVTETDADQVMLAGRYTVLDRSADIELLPACIEKSVAVVAAGVYNSGLLADPRPGATFDYADAPPHLVEQARAMQRLCAGFGVPLRAVAVQFPLRRRGVTQVAVGSRSPMQVLDNLEMLVHEVPDQLWALLDGVARGRST
jgi:D-threo-aldose 1-dehydrogenase